MSTVTLEAGRHAVKVARAEKVLFPARRGAPEVTKADLAAYYRDIAPYALPHLRDRPLMLEIHPDGIDGPRFMQKNVPAHYPDWIKRAELSKEGGTVTHVLANSADTLVYLAGQGCTTLHRWLARADRPRQPDRMVFDLDPVEDDFGPVRRAAQRLGQLLDELALPWAPMTSGSRGLHLTVPLDRHADVDEVRDFARAVADTLAGRYPAEFTTEPRKAARGRRLFLDVLRNGYAQTAVAPWSVRALPGAPVAAPVSRQALDDPELGARRWTVADALEQARSDPWDGLLPARGRSLGPAARRLRALG
ncbi:bifunctional non-homologous end joining protein LigD [Streptomyces sp. DvalAA-14]|uniref:non-homologous end-joining DNA ligase n=1 Tax=unclassified Streptomyces TaxID=2593676 RepID=UPI00081B7B03|nr:MULTISPECIES: non-homologous end-joining DNA ligase [unclassified Streptomyces]MYS22669.1 ATP-dependent DNA ligase [Streptomyces sp. SID4948]SCE20285.1 bifunctional non-homologous end joining protein LigD [Streptomyces sp. DvalAA-14]